jgi:hypothetical protein
MLLLAVSLGAAEAPAQETSDSPSSEEQIDQLEGQLEGMTEQLQTLQSDVDKLKKFKFSGYIQARWDRSENSSDSIRVAGTTITPANTNRFFIRRGRLKLTYEASELASGVFYIDGSSSSSATGITVRMIEAYVVLRDPWTVMHLHQLLMGQMNVPFGYEIERSSSTREVLERSRAANVLFPGERDRGLQIRNDWTTWLQTSFGVWNGPGIADALLPVQAPTSGKPVSARVRVDRGVLAGGLSWYGGDEVYPLTGPDATVDKRRLGFDVEGYYELPALGGGSVTFEFYDAEGLNADAIKANTTALKDTAGATIGTVLKPGSTASSLASESRGWYAMWVQNLGAHAQFALRYDTYDPNLDLDHDQYQRWNLALHGFYAGAVRATLQYEIPSTEAKQGDGSYRDPKDNALTAQLQIKY